MKQLTTLLIAVLAGCASGPESGPGPALDDGRATWKRMEERDLRLRARFEKIAIGMSRAEVRDLMHVEPDVFREDLWGFELSPASDTPTEIHWTLLVAFDDGEVSETDTSYTCLYRTPAK